ncbi:MAG: hypothetical protein AB8B93_16315 [Pseudomonadales bacterium]
MGEVASNESFDAYSDAISDCDAWFVCLAGGQASLRVGHSDVFGATADGDPCFRLRSAEHAVRFIVVGNDLTVRPLAGTVCLDGTQIRSPTRLAAQSHLQIGPLRLQISGEPLSTPGRVANVPTVSDTPAVPTLETLDIVPQDMVPQDIAPLDLTPIVVAEPTGNEPTGNEPTAPDAAVPAVERVANPDPGSWRKAAGMVASLLLAVSCVVSAVGVEHLAGAQFGLSSDRAPSWAEPQVAPVAITTTADTTPIVAEVEVGIEPIPVPPLVAHLVVFESAPQPVVPTAAGSAPMASSQDVALVQRPSRAVAIDRQHVVVADDRSLDSVAPVAAYTQPLVLPAAVPMPTATSLLADARAALQRGDAAAAQSLLTQAQKLAPENSQVAQLQQQLAYIFSEVSLQPGR